MLNQHSGIPKTIRSILFEMLNKEGISSDVVVEKSSEFVGRKGFDVRIIYADTNKVTSLQHS